MVRQIAFLFVLLLTAIPAFAQTDAAPVLPTPSDATAPRGSASSESTTSTGTSAPEAVPTANVYVKPTWFSLINTIVGFKALDFSADDDLIDEYAMVTNCDLYLAGKQDEFKWRKVRASILAAIQSQAQHYVVAYRYETPLQLDKYDFDTKTFRFAENTSVNNINAFLMSSSSPGCGRSHLEHLPSAFRAVLNLPVYVHGLPMEPEAGEALLQRMRAAHNINRVIYARFNMRIVYVERISKHSVLYNNVEKMVYMQGQDPASRVKLGAELDSVQFFEDQAMTKLLYTYTP